MKHFAVKLPFPAFLFLIIGTSFFLQVPLSHGQSDNEDAFAIKAIHSEILSNGQCYEWLRYLCKDIGPRLSGSSNAAAAVEYCKQVMDTMGLDSVWLQPVMVPRWVRGGNEKVRIVNSSRLGTMDLKATTLGNTIGTGSDGIVGEVIEVRSLQEVEELGAAVKGKIVFYNRPMDPTETNTFRAYGGAVDQRGAGPVTAAKHGAVAVLVRSMGNLKDDIPHTGAAYFDPKGKNVPAMALSTNDSDKLSNLLALEKVFVYMHNEAQMLDDVLSYNVIGEIRGSEKPDEIILVGGHLDSWDIGEGAHDDGAGCVQSMEVIYRVAKMDQRPRHTIRCVMFMNEENGLRGGTEYARVSNENGEFHLAAIESDAGGFTPRGFSSSAIESVFEGYYKRINEWLPLLEPYYLSLSTGGGGADINPLKSQGGLLIGFRPDSQRYFSYHHTGEDTFDKVHQRELEMGAATMHSLLFLIDKYGLTK